MSEEFAPPPTAAASRQISTDRIACFSGDGAGFGVPDRAPSPARYAIELRSQTDQPPAEIRLRRLMKAALRVYGFRVVSIAVPGAEGQCK